MKKIKIGIAGLGTVGKGVYEILKKDAALLAKRCETEFEIVAVSSRTKKDFVDPKIKFYTNAIDLASDNEVEVVVELIGGTTIAKELLEASIKNGKKFVTANKALLAEYGTEIANLAEKHQAWIGFEASTSGANPIIKALKEGLVANEVKEFYAILNGTCNFILSKMTTDGSDFSETLKEAQSLGYAEADPTLDIKGIDAAHKLTILASIASGTKPAFKQLHIEGVDEVSIEDVKLAGELGYKIKLLAIYKNLGESVQQTLYPALIKKSEKISQVDGPFNAVLVDTSNASWNMSIGRGAGGLTTGSAVVSDLVDIAMNRQSFLFGVRASNLAEARIEPISKRFGQYFLRLKVDKNLAKEVDFFVAVFGSKIEVEQVVFSDLGEEISCGFLTKPCQEQEVLEAFKNFDPQLVKFAKFLRVETTNF